MKCILVLLAFTACGWGQVSSGSLIGDVRDDKAASVPGVAITARNNATGFSRTATTNAFGGYRIDDLLPGVYTLTAQRGGFRTVTVSPVVVEVDQKARFDFELRAGSDAITVTAQMTPLQTDEPSEGYLFGSSFIQSLPLASRNIVSLV